MAVERRYLLASSLARLIQREGEPVTRLVEAYFRPRADRTQLVRVEHGRAALILQSKGSDGQISEEAVEVPLSHAEALVEVATGTIAFDRMILALSAGAEAVLDRFILPQELDLISVTVSGDPRLFAPPLWLGPEVTGEAAFAARELAIGGLPALPELEVSNAALEALLDTLEDRGVRRLQSANLQRTGRTEGRATATGDEGSSASTVQASAPDERGAVASKVEEPRPREEQSSLTTEKVEREEPDPGLPDVEDGPARERPQPLAGYRPILRTNIQGLDDGLARLARSLAPHGPRSTS
jgi:CYTH domain-containing protein